MIAFWLLPLVFILGVMLAIRGMRGRAIDTHPICRRCGFDLFGLPETSRQCSECGADLSAKKAIRIGHRRPRRLMAFCGFFLAVMSFGFIGVFVFDIAGDIHWIEYEPLWYVQRQASDSTAAVRDPALAEIARRMSAGKLSDADIHTIAAENLAIQANSTTTWSTPRGDFIEAAHQAGKLSDADWKQYISNGPQLLLTARAQIRRGDALPIRIATLGARYGSNSSYWAKLQKSTDDPLINKQDRQERGSGGMGLSARSRGSIGTALNFDPAALAKEPDGEKTLHMTAHLSLYDHSYSGDETPPLVTKDLALSAKWTLLPKDAKTVTAIKDDTALAAVEKAVQIESLRITPSSSNHPGEYWVNMQVKIDSTPVALSHTLTLRSAGREWPLNTSISVATGASTTWGTGGTVKDFQINGKISDTVDVVFHPSEKVALDTVEMTEYWNGEFVVKGVKVSVEKKQ